jgi:hypothetical protein
MNEYVCRELKQGKDEAAWILAWRNYHLRGAFNFVYEAIGTSKAEQHAN